MIVPELFAEGVADYQIIERESRQYFLLNDSSLYGSSTSSKSGIGDFITDGVRLPNQEIIN